MGPGGLPGLQNRRAAGFPVAGGFDSHSLPPFLFMGLRFFPASLELVGQVRLFDLAQNGTEITIGSGAPHSEESRLKTGRQRSCRRLATNSKR